MLVHLNILLLAIIIALRSHSLPPKVLLFNLIIVVQSRWRFIFESTIQALVLPIGLVTLILNDFRLICHILGSVTQRRTTEAFLFIIDTLLMPAGIIWRHVIRILIIVVDCRHLVQLVLGLEVV